MNVEPETAVVPPAAWGPATLLATALLLAASPWSARAGIAGGSLGALTFFVTTTMLLALPVWEAGSGGFPALNGLGAFLIKDTALLGVSLVVLGESLSRIRRTGAGGGA